MPRFDFQCGHCRNVIELTFRSAAEADEAPVLCAKAYCVRVPMTRMPSAPAFVLRGGGFHKNDYPSKS